LGKPLSKLMRLRAKHPWRTCRPSTSLTYQVLLLFVPFINQQPPRCGCGSPVRPKTGGRSTYKQAPENPHLVQTTSHAQLIISNGHSWRNPRAAHLLPSISSPSPRPSWQGRGHRHAGALAQARCGHLCASSHASLPRRLNPTKSRVRQASPPTKSASPSCPASLASTPPSSAEDGGAHGVARQEGRR